MKYTRYDIKKRRGNNFIFGAVLFSTLIFALIIGTIVSSMLFKDSTLKYIPNKEPNNASKVSNENIGNASNKTVKYIAVQGGVYKKAENAETTKNNLSEYGNPFTVQDDKGTRVFLGIYNEESGLNIIKMLNDKNISNSKMSFNLNISDNCDSVIAAIISSELDILSKLNDKGIKPIPTDEFKKWLTSLEAVDKESKNFSLLTELTSHINGLPKELSNDNSVNDYKYIYNLLKKLVQA